MGRYVEVDAGKKMSKGKMYNGMGTRLFHANYHEEVYKLLKKQNQEHFGFSKFCELRPENVKRSCMLYMCLLFKC